MTIILGFIVVVGAVLGGFSMAGGHIEALLHPSEVVTIGGAALGALIVMSPVKVIKDLFKGIINTLKGNPYGKPMYEELFKVTFDLMRMARREGLLCLERHVATPHESEIIRKYPKFAANHHAVNFLCGGLGPLVEGLPTEKISALLETELHVMEAEHHAPVEMLSKSADALPGFGIVAAVLGIVITMGAIDGPVEEVGHKVGAALVGTFLGILMSYGFIGPFAARMDIQGHIELAYFKTMTTIITEFSSGAAPKAAVETARRGVATEFRIDYAQLDELFRMVEAKEPAAAA